jgi:predicted ATP-grasp superfamily ATP-dependent carboligase
MKNASASATPKRSVVQRHKVAKRETINSEFEMCLFANSSAARGAPVLAGFGDIGITPIITTNSLIEKLELEQIGFLSSSKLPPGAVVSGGQARHSIRIYGDSRLVIVISDSKISKDCSASLLVDAILKIAKSLESHLIICTEGVPVETAEKIERKELQFVTTSESLANKLVELNHTPLQEAIVAGITGGLLAECTLIENEESELDICVILAPTCSLYPDVMSSVIIIQLLNELFSFQTCTKSLEDSAKKLEQKANELIGLHKNSSSAMNSLYM